MNAYTRTHRLNDKPLTRATAFLAALVCLCGSAAALADSGKHHPMRFDQLTQGDGLSQNNVFSILQDSSGFMWFGTENGLNRYDGYEFQVFKRERGNPEALGSDYVYDIAEAEDGSLWIATNGGGLALMDRDRATFQTFRHDPADDSSLSSNVIRSLHVDDDGSIWVGTLGAGVDRFNPKTGMAEHYALGETTDPSRDVNEVFELYRDQEGTLWAGTNDGLVAIDVKGGEVQHFQHDNEDVNSLSGHRVRAILEDAEGQLWVGTYASGLNRLDRDSGTFERFNHQEDLASSLSGDRVTSLFEDDDDRLWVGTYSGLNLYDRKSDGFVRYGNDSRDANSLGGDKVTTMFQDRGGILWVGTRNNGLSKWNPRTWSYGLEDARSLTAAGDSEPNVTSFVEVGNTLWIGTFGDGLHAVDRDTGETTTWRHDAAEANSISDDRVMSLALDRAGHLWIGTMTGGLDRLALSSGEITNFRHDESDPTSLSANGIMAIFTDSTGHVWAGTYGGGASRFDASTEEFTRFVPSADDAGAISSNRVRAFAEDSAGNIWIGTDSGGLNLFNSESGIFTHFRHDPFDPKTLADDTIYSLTVDAHDTVWVGTQGGGLDRVVGSASKPESIEFTNFSQADGLSNDVVYGVLTDNTGVVWASTNYGISRFEPGSGKFRNLHRRDGLQSEEFNSGAYYKSAAGELFFGGPNGYNAFDPVDVQISQAIPLVALTAITGGKDPIKADAPNYENGIELGYKDDTVNFEFAALDFTDSAQNQYRYKLEGFDQDWIDLGSRRVVTYTDLDDGQYLLRVQAANADGIWNEVGMTLPVKVTPAPWDTWWAYLGYAAMFVQLGVFLWLGHNRKIKREEEYSSRLEQEVRDRTQKLLESNSQLKKLNGALQESSLSDPLTGLRNRRFVFEEVSRDLDVIRRKLADEDRGLDPRKNSDLVFMMIDLDNFKPINDTYGHAAGDQMLLEVRDVLLGTCRKSDFIIRWGGDEFVVIAKQAKEGESEALAERIRSKIAEHSFLLADGQIVRTTCSIGFAAYPLHRGQAEDADLDAILVMADSLMYEAKRHRNAWAGILSPETAATSFDFDHESIEPSSILYRAKHAGQLIAHDSGVDHQDAVAESVSVVG